MCRSHHNSHHHKLQPPKQRNPRHRSRYDPDLHHQPNGKEMAQSDRDRLPTSNGLQRV
jgi:hypothetical protein